MAEKENKNTAGGVTVGIAGVTDAWEAFLQRKKLEDDQWFAALKKEAQRRTVSFAEQQIVLR